jgi:PEP-CTERM/exosortase A-associated glycosyltransferase
VTKEMSVVSADLEALIDSARDPGVRSFSKLGASHSQRKILHILDHSLPLHSGYTFRTQSILEELRRRNWASIALTSSKHEASWKGSSQQEEEIGGFRYYRTGALRRGSLPFEMELRLMRRLTRRIEEVANIEKPDLLHAHSPVLNVLPALWAGRKLGIPVVYEIRAFWEDAAVDHKTYSQDSLKYKMVRSMETWACQHAAQVAVLCNGLKGDLVQRGIEAEKLTVVFNGINPEDFRPCDPNVEFARSRRIMGKKVLGFIGSFYRYEGLDLLVKAFAKLAATRDDLVLLLVGGGEMEGELRDQIEQMQLQGRVILPGRISHDKIPGVYSLIDILVYPRYSMRLTELVTPLKPLEAMAMRKPVVGSDIGGHRELIREEFTGLLFKPGDIFALVGTLERLLDDPGLRSKLATQGNDWVRQNHTWEKTTSVYSALYSKALEKTLENH